MTNVSIILVERYVTFRYIPISLSLGSRYTLAIIVQVKYGKYMIFVNCVKPYFFAYILLLSIPPDICVPAGSFSTDNFLKKGAPVPSLNFSRSSICVDFLAVVKTVLKVVAMRNNTLSVLVQYHNKRFFGSHENGRETIPYKILMGFIVLSCLGPVPKCRKGKKDTGEVA